VGGLVERSLALTPSHPNLNTPTALPLILGYKYLLLLAMPSSMFRFYYEKSLIVAKIPPVTCHKVMQRRAQGFCWGCYSEGAERFID